MAFQLALDTPLDVVTDYLRQQLWLPAGASVSALEKPGEGNMNVVVRVLSSHGSFILKQARPYVQKYPHIPAPVERVQVEARFYEITEQQDRLQQYLPTFIGFDPEAQVLALEDLGAGADYTYIYRKGEQLSEEEIVQATRFLQYLHRADFPAGVRRSFPANLSLRRLNHEHLFQYPYVLDHGFDLDTVQPGLQELALPYKRDTQLKHCISTLGERYLSAGEHLLHGDYYPGSWLKEADGFRVIDPEFCFFGPAEYDCGVMIAHFMMAQLPAQAVDLVIANYQLPGFDEGLARQFTGMEILRRLIGLAQLPLELDLEEKQALLQIAAGLVKT